MAELYRSLHRGAVSTILSDNLPQDKVLISSTTGKVDSSTVTKDELSKLSGVSDNVQDQIDTLNTAIQNLELGRTTGTLTIGSITFDGSKNVNIPIYGGQTT